MSPKEFLGFKSFSLKATTTPSYLPVGKPNNNNNKNENKKPQLLHILKNSAKGHYYFSYTHLVPRTSFTSLNLYNNPEIGTFTVSIYRKENRSIQKL